MFIKATEGATSPIKAAVEVRVCGIYLHEDY